MSPDRTQVEAGLEYSLITLVVETVHLNSRTELGEIL